MLDGQVIATYLSDPTHGFCQICRMAEYVFILLGSFVGHLCECTEGCHIDEICAAVESADVVIEVYSVGDGFCAFYGFKGKSQ